MRNAVTPSENISSDGANADINCTGSISIIISPTRPIKAEYAPLRRITFLIRSACLAPRLNATIGIKTLFNPKVAIYTNVCNLKYAPNTAVEVVEKFRRSLLIPKHMMLDIDCIIIVGIPTVQIPLK